MESEKKGRDRERQNRRMRDVDGATKTTEEGGGKGEADQGNKWVGVVGVGGATLGRCVIRRHVRL